MSHELWGPLWLVNYSQPVWALGVGPFVFWGVVLSLASSFFTTHVLLSTWPNNFRETLCRLPKLSLEQHSPPLPLRSNCLSCLGLLVPYSQFTGLWVPPLCAEGWKLSPGSQVGHLQSLSCLFFFSQGSTVPNYLLSNIYLKYILSFCLLVV